MQKRTTSKVCKRLKNGRETSGGKPDISGGLSKMLKSEKILWQRANPAAVRSHMQKS